MDFVPGGVIAPNSGERRLPKASSSANSNPDFACCFDADGRRSWPAAGSRSGSPVSCHPAPTRRRIEDPQKLAAFAAQTARNLAIASLRKAERQKTDVDSEATDRNADPAQSVDRIASDLEAALAVRALLRELPQARDRLMLKRFYLDDHDKDLICQELDLSEAAFNQALSRARRRFRQILEERGFAKRDLLSLGL
jgi:RNA polymerase sigma factor (sigma-70 family)